MDEDFRERARERRARARLSRLQRRLDVHTLLQRGVDRDEILRLTAIGKRTFERMAKGLDQHPPRIESAEELILRADVERLDRQVLVEVLGGLDYDAEPNSHRWTDVVDAVYDEQLSPEELDAVRVMRLAIRKAAREGWSGPLEAASSMQMASDNEDHSRLLRVMAETRSNLRELLREAPDLAPAWRAAPGLVHEHWDALLAAVVEHEYVIAAMVPPAWTLDRALHEDWVVDMAGFNEECIRAATPPWLAARRIYVCGEALGPSHD